MSRSSQASRKQGGARELAVSAAHAHALSDEASLQAARYLCHRGKGRVEALFAEASRSPDSEAYRLAMRMQDQQE